MDKGLKLWEEWFEWDGTPWIDDDYGRTYCFFCIEEEPNHSPSCIFIKARNLLLENRK